jgi:hypothetical protein
VPVVLKVVLQYCLVKNFLKVVAGVGALQKTKFWVQSAFVKVKRNSKSKSEVLKMIFMIVS